MFQENQIHCVLFRISIQEKRNSATNFHLSIQHPTFDLFLYTFCLRYTRYCQPHSLAINNSVILLICHLSTLIPSQSPVKLSGRPIFNNNLQSIKHSLFFAICFNIVIPLTFIGQTFKYAHIQNNFQLYKMLCVTFE